MIKNYKTRKHNIPLLDHEVEILSAASIDDLLDGVEEEDDIPFWSELWPSARGLAQHLWERKDLAGQSLLELGCGVGLCSIIAAIKGAKTLATDRFGDALSFARYNAGANGVNPDYIDFAMVDWRDCHLNGAYDFIIGSDILYEPTLHLYLQSVLERKIKPGGKLIIADPGRKYSDDFILTLEERGWELSDIESRRVPGEKGSINIFEVTAPLG